MSTDLGTLKTSNNPDVEVTRFFGGTSRGLCLQLTQRTDRGWQHVQLDVPQLLALTKLMQQMEDV
jgi:hypothetical protein